MTIKPRALAPGANIGIVAPASPALDLACVIEGKKLLEGLGFKVTLAPNALKMDKYLAGTDQERLADLCEMFLNPDIDGIVCLRGGYGSIRIVPDIDYSLVRRYPKVLVGYSDITILQLAILKKTGLVTFSGPMLATEFGCEPNDFTVSHFIKAITDVSPLGSIPTAPGAATVTINPGKASGRLTGGNLSLVAATLGTPYEIDTHGAILYLEEVDEPPYRIDRLLWQLYLAGKLNSAAGIVFGECINCKNEKHSSYTLIEILIDICGRLNKPSFYGLSAGHGACKATLPLGVKAQMDAGKRQLVIMEPATIK